MAVNVRAPAQVVRAGPTARQFWVRAGIVILALAGAQLLLGRIARVETRSVPYHFVWIAGGTPAKGEFAIVTLKHEAIAPDGREARITKQLVCVPGDYLRFDGTAWFCNGALLGERLATTLSGKPLEPFVYDGPVPEGQGFVMGTSPYSFDSRYLGFLPLSSMVRVRGIF